MSTPGPCPATTAAITAASDSAVIAGAATATSQAPAAAIRALPPIVESIDRDALKAAALDVIDHIDAEAPPVLIDIDAVEIRGIVESLLLVATKPLSVARFVKCIPGATDHYLAGFLEGLAERYEVEQRGWELKQVAGGWQLLTRARFHPWVRQLDKKTLPTRLSRSALETLAIVAYKQPVSRGAIEDIRGVQCGPMLRQLMDMKLAMVIGREEDTLGHPLLYGTTEEFLQRFGLATPGDLPRRHEFGA
jgi:segregation and condensation protein B